MPERFRLCGFGRVARLHPGESAQLRARRRYTGPWCASPLPREDEGKLPVRSCSDVAHIATRLLTPKTAIVHLTTWWPGGGANGIHKTRTHADV